MTVTDAYDLSLDLRRGPWQPRRQHTGSWEPDIQAMFRDGVAEGQSHFDDDWYRFYPDGTYEVHELCGGCQPDGSCPFHPPGCRCSRGECQRRGFDFGAWTEALDEHYEAEQRRIERLAKRLERFASRWNRKRVSLDEAAFWQYQHA